MRVPRPSRVLVVRLMPPNIGIPRVLRCRRRLSPDAWVEALRLLFLIAHKTLDHLCMVLVMLLWRLGIGHWPISLRCAHHWTSHCVLLRAEIHSRALVKLRLPGDPGGVWLRHIRWRPSIESRRRRNVIAWHVWCRRVSVRWDWIVWHGHHSISILV